MFNSPILQAFKDGAPHHHLYCVNTKHVIMSCNDQQAIDLGFESESAIIGRSINELSSYADVYIASNENIFRNGKTTLFYEPTDIVHNEKIIVYASYKMPVRDLKGKITGVMGISIPTDNITVSQSQLSPQQQKCVDLLIQGFSLKEIATDMGLSYKTIEHYFAAIRAKFQCKTTRELILKLK